MITRDDKAIVAEKTSLPTKMTSRRQAVGVMGTTVAAVYRLHSRANQLLRECMSKETGAWTRT